MTRREAEEAAARWLLRREEAELSGAEQAALDEWLEADSGQRAAFWRLQHGMQKLARLPALQGYPVASAPPRMRPAPPKRRPRWAAAMAASLGVGAVLLAAPFLSSGKIYETEVGGRQHLPLPDGTKVDINTATKLRADVTPQKRAVWLEHGEAFFEVAHDPDHPFVVHAGSKTITVLGTKFSVRRDGDRVEVVVLEGKVRFGQRALARDAEVVEAAVLTHGDIVVAEGEAPLIAVKSDGAVGDALSWRQGRLRFNETTLADAAREFNRYNQIQLVVDDPRAASVRIGGSYDFENVVEFASLLQRAYGFKIEGEGDTLTVSNPP